MELTTSLDEICRIVARAREFDAQVPAVDPDDGSNMADDDAVDVLEDETNTSVEQELRTALEDLNEDEQQELLALVLVGRGTYDAGEWEDALQSARDDVTDYVEELYETPMLASLIEAGLAAFDLSCDDVGTVS
ncbi:hypothetical protein B5C34_14410 [Pacificimonas flava]|uniref:DUF3775 domain-containing protein n=2 Tax=Pacificimonas TaxID=1960290 RepID=A0A219B8Q2_9SPHN|nr:MULTISPECIES: DUF3775 domain-containing protein [Pacificimonas]MBZ6380018.1 DUF3775 domain-containing protein [Pacificimonas aurantium]OWV34533.1 hypothetical protein B5C34_14410 [Pacificimonas flava]